jgi:predicted ATPase
LHGDKRLSQNPKLAIFMHLVLLAIPTQGLDNTLPVLGRNYVAAAAQVQEVLALAEEKGASPWKGIGMMDQGCILALTGETSNAVQLITSGNTIFRSTGGTTGTRRAQWLAKAYADLGQFDDAWICISEAMTAVVATKETWFEAEVIRVAGEIALMSSEPDAAKAEAHFERALAVARTQQAKSWELRAAMSMARLWLDQGKRDAARELLAPVYGWFTEGFDTLDLKEARSLLDVLHA